MSASAERILRQITGLDLEPESEPKVETGRFIACPGCNLYISTECWSEHKFNGCGDPDPVERFVCTFCSEDYATYVDAADCCADVIEKEARESAADLRKLKDELGD